MASTNTAKGRVMCRFNKFDQCFRTFADEKEMKRHMVNADDHDYCRKCDETFKDWNDFVAHKASPACPLISCKFCGVDFKTTSGRDRHLRSDHPVDQNLHCVGCGDHFTRAAALIDHLERGRCKYVKKEQFAAHIQHKTIINKLLEAPELMSPFTERNDLPADTDTTGGVKLGPTLLDDEAAIPSSHSPLTPARGPNAGRGPRLGERWPALGSSTKSEAEDASVSSLGSKLGGISVTGRNETDIRDSILEDTAADYRRSMRPAPKPAPKAKPAAPASAASPVPTGTAYSETWRNRAESATTTATSGTATPVYGGKNAAATLFPDGAPTPTTGAATPVWGGKNAASTLFPDALPTPITPEWQDAFDAQAAEQSQNIFRIRFWDPTHKDYNPERFYNRVIEQYCCPFPHCDARADVPLSLESHIKTFHRPSQLRCPSCLKLFKSITALVSHCEAANSRCSIQRSERFGQAIDEFSGGFLGVREAEREDISEEVDGYVVEYTRFEGTLPPDWTGVESGRGIKVGGGRI
ncbi:hypothetical protein H2201_004584 [Coniosporium apollinis]|uniref:C2H2-type domain-containing protein n=1 Tax=Coniosporium apollinis TaxID=61459 RepID=A0ABQ9NT45_9PEZI|nr:hypothetical protein H2201_004584 [Coniosporium apollinis]